MIYAVGVLGLLLIALTALPLLPSQEKWVRVWDFPRLQIAVLLGATLATSFFVLPLANPFASIFHFALALSLVWQLWQVRPYTALHATQVGNASHCPENSTIKILIANVLKNNRDSGRLFEIIKRHEPDVFLLVETDQWWDSQLGKITTDYPHAIRHPQDNTYGMHLFSKLKLKKPQIRHLLSDDIPSIKTGITLPSGNTIVLYGVHPRPPPRADTAQRDAELVLVGREVRRGAEPAIVAGDLNDVAWSRTTHLFQEISGLLDPRVGRGLFPTFHADWRLFRWPLDHVFFSPEFRLIDLAVMPAIGSDHFPLLASLCHRPGKADGQAAPEPERSDIERASEVIAAGREAAAREE